MLCTQPQLEQVLIENPHDPRIPRAIVTSAKIRSNPSHPCPCFRSHPLPSVTGSRGWWVGGAQDEESTTSPSQASNLTTEKIRENPPHRPLRGQPERQQVVTPSPRIPRANVASAKIRSNPPHPCPCFRPHPLSSVTGGAGGLRTVSGRKVNQTLSVIPLIPISRYP